MIPLVLVLTAVLLAWPAPRVLAGIPALRRTPRAALFAYQASTVSAIVAMAAAAPAILPLVLFDGQAVWQHFVIIVIAAGFSALMLVRFLVAGHRTGRRVRLLRARHRELVDIIARQEPGSRNLRILDHPVPTAYCLPGYHARVVVSRAVIEALDDTELAAVLAHERSHLRSRHDLLVEFLSVIHETVPGPMRCQAAMGEVRLLVEALADRTAAREVGVEPMSRALGALAGGRVPEAAFAVSGPTTAPLRVELLHEPPPSRALGLSLYASGAAVLATPLALLGVAFL